MSSLPGNPHERDYDRASGDGAIAAATMALAFEQRTANLIARQTLEQIYLRSTDWKQMPLAGQIDARLFGPKEPAAPVAPARTVHDEAQELHRIIGRMLEDGGTYDTLGSYEEELTRARELAATYVADTDPDQ